MVIRSSHFFKKMITSCHKLYLEIRHILHVFKYTLLKLSRTERFFFAFRKGEEGIKYEKKKHKFDHLVIKKRMSMSIRKVVNFNFREIFSCYISCKYLILQRSPSCGLSSIITLSHFIDPLRALRFSRV